MVAGANLAVLSLLLLVVLPLVPAQGRSSVLHHNSRRLAQSAVAPASVGDVCSNGLICPQHQRCDVTLLSGNDGTQKFIQCLCVTGYNGPECPLPYTNPPAATNGPVSPSPPAPTAPKPSPALTASPPSSGQVCSNGLVCPAHQRCDVTLLSGNDGTQKVIQCLCETGYNGPECPLPYKAPPAATNGVVTPSPPKGPFAEVTYKGGSANSAAAAVSNPATLGSSTPAPKHGSSGIGVGGAVGIAVGCVVTLVLIALGVVYGLRRRRQEQKAVEFQDFHKAHHALDLNEQPPPPPEPVG